MAEPMILGGRYELGGVLGRGGMAEVRQARDARLGREVAVKQLRVDLASDPTFQARFRREAQSSAGLNHPNIVAVYDTGEQRDPVSGGEIPYIVMELVEGKTLRELLRDGRKILPERALEITQGVLEALSYSHKAGIVHRDIKPANVMLTPSGGIKVMDFGIARAVADTSATMTQTAAVIGTAQYLSPEQARGETVDARSDVYSTGCLLYELLTGRPPFIGDSPVSVAYQHVREEPVPPSQRDPLVTAAMDAIVLTALTKDAAHRYQSARDMGADIGRLLNGQDVTAALPSAAVLPAGAVADGPTSLLTPSTRLLDQQPKRAVSPAPADADDLDGEEEEERKKRTRMWAIIAVLALVAIGLGAAGLIISNPNSPTPSASPAATVLLATVPDVTTLPPATAKDKLEAAGFTVKTNNVRGEDDATVDTVTEQDPAGNSQAETGSEITITVNQGPKQGTIPDGLVGSSRDAAKQKLEDAGFTDVKFAKADNEPASAQKDEVTAVSPDEGSNANLTDSVTVRYATGQTQVPDWMGWTRDAVETDAKARGLSVEFTEAVSQESPSGTVIKSSPKPGKTIDKSDRITVTLAKLPPPPPTPTETETSKSAPPSPKATSPSPEESPDSPSPSPSASPTR